MSGGQAGSSAGSFPLIIPGTEPIAPEPASVSRNHSGFKYELQVIQQPRRARMCGFGDKDRRPITPPPCIRLVITDIQTGKEVDVNDINHGFFILQVDLWSRDGRHESNLVRHSAPAPNLQNAATATYTESSQPGTYTSPSTYDRPTTGYSTYPNQGQPAANQYPQPHPPYGQQSYGQQQQQIYPPAQPYPQPQSYTQYPPPQSYQPIYPPASHVTPFQPPPLTPQNNGFYSAPLQGPPIISAAGIHGLGRSNSITSIPPETHYEARDSRASIAYSANDLAAARRAGYNVPTSATSAPTGMFTRNLIGSLAASAFRLTDPDNRIGFWFVLQDLSVRTEGDFRLRFSFVNVGAPGTEMNSDTSRTHGHNAAPVNTGSAPILAVAFSETFTVYSAKRFPGVVESTALSKCFATQGIKIPIRKDGPSGRGRDDDEED